MGTEKLNYLLDRDAELVGHSDNSLLHHLTGTETLLNQWGLDTTTCDAGLFHSVYGTESFRTSLVSSDQRQEVVDQIGADAERLAFLFCTMVKSSLDDNLDGRSLFTLVSRFSGETIEITRAEFVALAHISLANWIEQRDRHGSEFRDFRADAFRAMSEFLVPAARKTIRDFYGGS